MTRLEIDNIPEEILSLSVLCEVPYALLFGIQRPDEYSASRLKKAEMLLTKKGKEAFNEQPPIFVVIEYGQDIVIAIIDGHHRVRAAGKESITSIPGRVFSLAVIARLANMSPDELRSEITTGISEAMKEFADRYGIVNKTYQPPQSLNGSAMQEELKSKVSQVLQISSL